MIQQVATESLLHAALITLLVFVMMVVVDIVDVVTRGKMGRLIRGGLGRQYVAASFLGATPGCLGLFINVSFYLRGLLSFGAIAGGMVATCGDASFVMLAMFPGKALVLFAILFVMGIIWAPLVDRFLARLQIRTCRECEMSIKHKEEECFRPRHYLREHVWGHLIRRHIWKIFLWSFGALFIVYTGLELFDVDAFVESHLIWVFLSAVLLGLIPDSGPLIIFVVMFSKGVIPFSVLLTASVVHGGHGILPLLSHSVKDSALLLLSNLLLGLVVGTVFYLAGV